MIAVIFEVWPRDGRLDDYLEIAHGLRAELEQIDGIWTPLEMVMTTKKGKQTEHASVLRWDDVKYNQPMDDELFTQRRLSQGL